MTMPNNLVLIRHGQSEANIFVEASKRGDNSLYTDEFMNYPDRSWRLTSLGVQQAKTAGQWITQNVPGFDRYITSPYTRTRETAANLSLPNAQWEENRVIRERSWGEIDSIPFFEFKQKYPANFAYKKKDPLYWSPPAGESIANVAENRVRNILSTLHRENKRDNVLMVTHGEFIWAMRLVIERWSDEEFLKFDKEPDMKIHNCTVIHYTRVNPITSVIDSKLRWVRKAYPVCENNTWNMKVGEWQEFSRQRFSNEELLVKASVESHKLQ